MADNIDEEHADNREKYLPEKYSDEIVPSKETKVINSNTEPEKMEVHHHSHSEHGKKNWKSYFREFLMLFLAVFCGFLAEYQLERTIENHREKAFMISLLQDLKQDTTALSDYNSRWISMENKIDSLRTIIEPPFQSVKTELAYYYSAMILYFMEFNYNDRTVEQLRSSGNFRLIRAMRVVTALVDYDNSIRNQIRNIEAAARDQLLKIMSQQSELFHSKHIDEYLKGAHSLKNPPVNQLYKVENKPELLFRYYNELYKYQLFARGLALESKELKLSAINLIALIKKEYDIE